MGAQSNMGCIETLVCPTSGHQTSWVRGMDNLIVLYFGCVWISLFRVSLYLSVDINTCEIVWENL